MILAEEIGLEKQELKDLITVFDGVETISEAILFGSRALGIHRIGSDIDIALKGNSNHKEWLDLMIEIDNLDFPYKFDLIQYEKVDNQELISHIERIGKVLYKE
ncbi:MAG: putative nucleotidyltransferase [Dokdonia sp.]|jgi:predicted nucleotidyltransferase